MSVTFLLNQRSLAIAEDYVTTSESVSAARDEAITVGAPTLSNGVLSALIFFARTLDARNVVEVGTGTGASGLAFFSGMHPEGVVTSIDVESEWQLAAKRAFAEQGIPTRRFRLIPGNPLDVLNNLRDGAYDIVLVNGDKLEYVEYVDQAERLLRPGGMLVVNDALWQNLVADPSDEADETVIIREALSAVAESESFITPMLIPLGEGLLVAVRS